jgi:sulfur carrier protein
VKIVVNGELHEIPQGSTIADLVERSGVHGERHRGVAVAVDAEVVPRSAWGDTELSEGQKVELVAAMQGG